MTPFPTPEPDAGATNMPNPNPSAPEGVQAVADDLRAESALARIMDPNAFDDSFPINPDRRAERQDSALTHAIAAIEAGFRRVSVDDDTVERVAEAARLAYGSQDFDKVGPRAFWQTIARAAVQALLGGGSR